MKTVKLEIELMLDDELMYGGDHDVEGKRWFYDEILSGNKGHLILHSNEIGDEVGRVVVKHVHST